MSYVPMSIEEKRRHAHLILDLRSAMLVGEQAPIVRAMWDRHRSPQPGDWVIETSTIHRLTYYPDLYDTATYRSLWDGQFTRFLRSEQRPIYTPDEWAEAADPEDGTDPPRETVYICENPDGTEYAWTNAELAVVPLDSSLAPKSFT